MVVHVLHTVLTTVQAVVQALQLDKSSSDLELEPEEEAYVRDLDLDPQRAAKPFFTGVC